MRRTKGTGDHFQELTGGHDLILLTQKQADKPPMVQMAK